MSPLERLQLESRLRFMSPQMLYDIWESRRLNELEREMVLKNMEAKIANRQIKKTTRQKFAETRRKMLDNRRQKKKIASDFMEVMEGLLFIVPADQYIPATTPVAKTVAPPVKTKSFERTRNYIEETPKEFTRPSAVYSNKKAIDKYL